MRYVYAMEANDRFTNRHGLGNMTEASQDIALEILTMPGKSYQDIAGKHGVSRQRVGQIARRLDIGRKTRQMVGDEDVSSD